jgi:hypothetical protein
MSKKKRATVEEFVVTGNEVKHVPTNATFYAYEGGRQISRFLVGSMGSVLPNGDDYDVDSIKEIAAKLMRERPALKSQ